MPSEVPTGWRLMAVRSAAKLRMGETIVAKNLTGDGIPVYSAGRATEPWGFTSASKKRFRRGTVVVGARGTLGYPRLPDHEVFVSTQTTIAASPTEGLIPEYLCSALGGLDYSVLGAQQAVPMLTVDALGSARILVPPLPEQKKIAAILSSVDEAVEATQAVIQQTRRVKEGLLQDLLTRGIGRDGLPHTRLKNTEIGAIPESWEVVSNDQFAEVTSSKRVFKHDYVENGVPFYRSKEIILKARGREATDPYFISQERFRELSRKHGAPVDGDILISAVGSIGFVYMVRNDGPFYFKDGNLLWIRRYKREVDPGFLRYAYRSAIFQHQLDRVTGGSSQSALTIEKLRRLMVPLPPLDEQVEIRSRLEAIDRVLDSQTQQRQVTERLRAGLLQNLLTGKVRVAV
jgi:restriction endonuclease S subunit